jgi:hypothetical protein
VVAVGAHYRPETNPDEFLVPAPVRAVLRSWKLVDGLS